MRSMARLLWRALFVLVVVLLLRLALQDHLEVRPDWFPQADKLRHALAFALLWLLGWKAQWGSVRHLALGLLALGVGIEVAQWAFTLTREASLGDVLADGVGMALGRWLAQVQMVPAEPAVDPAAEPRISPPTT